jgi:hypothetical protein
VGFYSRPPSVADFGREMRALLAVVRGATTVPSGAKRAIKSGAPDFQFEAVAPRAGPTVVHHGPMAVNRQPMVVDDKPMAVDFMALAPPSTATVAPSAPNVPQSLSMAAQTLPLAVHLDTNAHHHC